MMYAHFLSFLVKLNYMDNNIIIIKKSASKPTQRAPLDQPFFKFSLFGIFFIAVRYIFIGVLDDCIIFKFDIRAAKKPDKT